MECTPSPCFFFLSAPQQRWIVGEGRGKQVLYEYTRGLGGGLQGVNLEMEQQETSYSDLLVKLSLNSSNRKPQQLLHTHTSNLVVDPTSLPGLKPLIRRRRVGKASSSRSPPASHRGLHLEADKGRFWSRGKWPFPARQTGKSRMFLK
jgi:hypothetical protein